MYSPDSRLANVWLVSFADSRLVKPKVRLRHQALAFGIAEDHILIKDENDLTSAFRAEMRDHLILGSRGYGYWCWKPEVCLEVFKLMNDGDVLLFLDVGCHLRVKGKRRFFDYLKTVEEQGLLGFQSRSLVSDVKDDFTNHAYPNSMLTKGDVFDYFGVRHDELIVRSGQMEACSFFLKKNARSQDFLSRWMKVYRDDFSLMDDSPSRSSNFPGFVENRHDQSALTILWLMGGYPTCSACEIEPLYKYATGTYRLRWDEKWGASWFSQMSRFPIQARRDKGLIPFPMKVYRFIRYRLLRRLFKR